jgi:hypothetical protein
VHWSARGGIDGVVLRQWAAEETRSMVGQRLAERNQLRRLDIKSNRFRGSKKRRSTVEDGGRQYSISKWMAGAIGRVGKTKKYTEKKKKKRVGWGRKRKEEVSRGSPQVFSQ